MKYMMIFLLFVLMLVMNINGKIIPMSFVYHAPEVSNAIESNDNVQVSRDVNDDNERVQSGPTKERLEELYKIINTMSIPCVHSLRSIEPIIRHKFIAKNEPVTDEEISTLTIMIDNMKLIGIINNCEGRRFKQPPLPWSNNKSF